MTARDTKVSEKWLNPDQMISVVWASRKEQWCFHWQGRWTAWMGEPTERGGDLKELVRLAGDGQGRQHRSASNIQVELWPEGHTWRKFRYQSASKSVTHWLSSSWVRVGYVWGWRGSGEGLNEALSALTPRASTGHPEQALAAPHILQETLAQALRTWRASLSFLTAVGLAVRAVFVYLSGTLMLPQAWWQETVLIAWFGGILMPTSPHKLLLLIISKKHFTVLQARAGLRLGKFICSFTKGKLNTIRQ